jgi:hypothetical protein
VCPVSELRSAIDGFAAVDVRDLTDVQLADELAELQRAVNRLDAQFERRLAVFDARGIAEQRGQLSTASWLTHELRIDPAEASWRVRLARRVSQIPQAAAAFVAGDIAVEHARVIGVTVSEMKDEKKAWAEDVLLGAAESVEPIVLDRVGRQLRYEVDPDAADEKARKQHDGRRLSVASTFGGMVSVNGVLEPAAGAVVQTALNAFMAPHADDERTAKQRRADALEEICRRILKTDEPRVNGGHRPQLLVRTSLEALREIAGADLPQLPWGIGPLGRADLHRLACDSDVIRVVMGGKSEVLDVGRAQRTFPIGIRRALLAQWETCFWVGCNQPAQWAEGHHIVPWEFGRETSVANGLLPCAYHHHVIHRDGWQLEKLADGTVIARLGTKEMVCKPNAP